MKWSWKLSRIAGIDVFIHTTFFILIAWIAMIYWRMNQNIDDVINAIVFILAIFSCIVLHELGHALTARRYGIKTKNITLLPIGGVALLERMPEDPKQEIKVAIAGPIVNLIIVLFLYLWLNFTDTVLSSPEASFEDQPFALRLLVVNLALAVFNLLPAFPMDGGRIFRAALSFKMSRVQATQIAAATGQLLAFMLGYLGLLYNPFLVFIALFVWIGAAAEAGMEKIKDSLLGQTAGDAMLTDFQSIQPNDTLAKVISLTIHGSQKDFPVAQNGDVIGVLTQMDLLKGLQKNNTEALVSDWMQTSVEMTDVSEPVTDLLQKLQNNTCRLIGVTDNKRLVGIINLDNISELIAIQRALKSN